MASLGNRKASERNAFIAQLRVMAQMQDMGKKYREIARDLNIPMGTVYSRLHRLRVEKRWEI